MVDFAEEVTWLRFRIKRLRAILRVTTDPHSDLGMIESALRELIIEGEKRLELLEASGRRPADRRERHGTRSTRSDH